MVVQGKLRLALEFYRDWVLRLAGEYLPASHIGADQHLVSAD
jgi:hypothetical protein